MKKIKLGFTLAILFVSLFSFGQKSTFYSVSFKFHHSRRIANNDVSIEFKRSSDSVKVVVKSFPIDKKDKKWKKTIKEYDFKISMTEYEKICASLKKINCSDILTNLDYLGVDGTTCEISFGSTSTKMTYKIWTPTDKTVERNLSAFLEACKLIVQTGKLNPEEIL